jgi:hypothetical protein
LAVAVETIDRKDTGVSNTDEEFTMYCDSAGDEVRKPLGEMSATEVLSAMNWHQEAGDRLAALVAAGDAREAELMAAIPARGPRPGEREWVARRIATLKASGEVTLASARLGELVIGRLPDDEGERFCRKFSVGCARA